MLAFDESEAAGFTATAATLANSNSKQGLSFRVWGNPERQKINEMAPTANQLYLSEMGVF